MIDYNQTPIKPHGRPIPYLITGRFSIFFLLIFQLTLLPCLSAQEPRKNTLAHQQRNVRGTIVDESGAPVAGASVQIKGTSKGAITNQAGGFTLEGVSGNIILMISGVSIDSLETDIISTGTPLHISVTTKYATMDQVVVASTGYQKVKPNEVTGSLALIDNKSLHLQAGPRILDRLNGVAPGVLFPKGKSDAPELMIRGLSTINGPKAPLVILDDFPYEGRIENIHPEEIENITILKDAAAASIWGARAGNGVIVITTKKGRSGAGVQVSFDASSTIFEKPRLFDISRMSSADYVNLEQNLYKKGYYNSFITSPVHPPLSPAVEIMIQQDSGTLTDQQAQLALNALKQKDSRTEYLKDFYVPAFNQQYAVSASGGTDKITWLFFGGYERDRSYKSEAFEKFNFRLQNDYHISKKLSAFINASYTESKNGSGAPDLAAMKVGAFVIPYLSFSNAQGDAIPLAISTRLGYIDTLGRGKLLDGKYYPLTDWKHRTNKTEVSDLTATAGMRYALLKGVDLDLKYLYERQNTSTRDLADVNSYNARSLINLFTQLNPGTGTLAYIVPTGGILNPSSGVLQAGSLRSTVNMNKKWWPHQMSGLLGFEIRQVKNKTSSNTLYGYNDDNLTFTPVDGVNPYPVFGGGSSYIPANISLGETQNRFVSLFGNVAYNYKNRYMISASARRDASNLFGVHTNERWNPFWSAGAAWDLSKEPFYHFGKLHLLKLRFTYGYSGNFDPSKAAVTTLSVNSGVRYTNYNYAVPSNYANPDLQWERVATLNAGVDVETANRILSGSLEYFQKYATDLFGPDLLDYTAGLRQSTIIRNVASMKASGVDLTLRTLNINHRFKWNTVLQLSYYTDQITTYYKAPVAAYAYIRNGNSVNSIKGLPVYSLVSYRFEGLDPQTGAPLGNLNGQVSVNYTGITGYRALKAFSDLDKVLGYDGPGLPKWYGSLLNSFSFKGFTLSANITYKLGYYFRYDGLDYSRLFGTGAYPGSGDYVNRWQQPGDELHTAIPSMVYPLVNNRDNFYTNSSATVLKGDHIRLQFVNLAYEFTNFWLSSSKQSSAQLYLNLSNIGLLWKANSKGIDPDYHAVIPEPRCWTVGLRANF